MGAFGPSMGDIPAPAQLPRVPGIFGQQMTGTVTPQDTATQGGGIFAPAPVAVNNATNPHLSQTMDESAQVEQQPLPQAASSSVLPSMPQATEAGLSLPQQMPSSGVVSYNGGILGDRQSNPDAMQTSGPYQSASIFGSPDDGKQRVARALNSSSLGGWMG